jgi:hypothetical protein
MIGKKSKFEEHERNSKVQEEAKLTEAERRLEVAKVHRGRLSYLELLISNLEYSLTQNLHPNLAEEKKNTLRKYRKKYNKLKANIPSLDPQNLTVLKREENNWLETLETKTRKKSIPLPSSAFRI